VNLHVDKRYSIFENGKEVIRNFLRKKNIHFFLFLIGKKQLISQDILYAQITVVDDVL